MDYSFLCQTGSECADRADAVPGSRVSRVWDMCFGYRRERESEREEIARGEGLYPHRYFRTRRRY